MEPIPIWLGQRRYEARGRLIEYILEKNKKVELSGCRFCPACLKCLKETPNCFSICLYCNGLMVSHGIRPPVFEIIDNDTDGEKRQIDEQIRKMTLSSKKHALKSKDIPPNPFYVHFFESRIFPTIRILDSRRCVIPPLNCHAFLIISPSCSQHV